MLAGIWTALCGQDRLVAHVAHVGQGAFASAFAVSDFAAATTGTAALALAEFTAARGGIEPSVEVDRRLASMWFAKSIRPVGWALKDPWDPIAGNYAARDGWVRLHTNAPHHRAAALAVLGVGADRTTVTQAVARWDAQELEDAVVGAKGCAARLRSLADWHAHPQGRAVMAEDLVRWGETGHRPLRAFGTPGRPLAGLRVLDLTRVLAGPVATRFLAGFGADVLRIDPPDWDEPAVLPEVTPGKICARLNLRETGDREIFARLLAEADVLVHGYRSDALEQLGFGAVRRADLGPGLIDVALDAYGWTGPWAQRRGFDTVVQMSTGLAEAEMRFHPSSKPENLPVQALDYGTGHLIAAAVLRALTQQAEDGRGRRARLSLARSAAFLALYENEATEALAPETAGDLSPGSEATFWGPARRLKPPMRIAGCDFYWDRSAGPLGDGAPVFFTSMRI
jgi:crotonobetainyl-CoA:carnitine CoA-transferase CaiB-like acyl-CoA transferase